MFKFVLLLAALAVTAQGQRNTTPVPILRQINSHNDDGSYTYGYEAADGAYKIETKAATGEVRGKYGYVDSDGNLREVEYGANRNGFNPSGTGIRVPAAAPSKSNIISTNPQDYDDGQYRPGPDEAGLSYTQNERVQNAPVSRFTTSRNSIQRQPQQPQQQYYEPEQPQQQYYQPQPSFRSINLPAQVFHGHPARNIDLNSGSYSIQY